jgi:hypothetical protein
MAPQLVRQSPHEQADTQCENYIAGLAQQTACPLQ